MVVGPTKIRWGAASLCILLFSGMDSSGQTGTDARVWKSSDGKYSIEAAIVELGMRHGVPFERTVSCYDAAPDGGACGACDACRLRRDGFAAAGVADPTRYA